MQAVSRYRGTPVLTLKGREVRVLMTANVILRPALYGQWQGGENHSERGPGDEQGTNWM